MPYPRRSKEPAIIKVELPWHKQLAKDLKMAVTTIKYNRKRYIAFFIVILLLQSLFSSVLILNIINNTSTAKTASDKYDYHLNLKDLNDAQAYYIINQEKELSKEEKYFKIAGMQRGIDEANSQYKYDLQIEFIGSSVLRCYDTFVDMYYPTVMGYGDFTETLSPLYQIHKRTQTSVVVCVLSCAAITVFSFLMIYILFSVMTNHYKFTYGIYQSFGANFKKLFSNSIAEFIVLCSLVLVPSAMLSNIICFVIAIVSKLEFVFCWYAPILAYIFVLIATGVAVFINMRATASKCPNDLIRAADNANHLISPRDSEDLDDMIFPRDTTILSFKRFRKYYIKLVSGALIFSMLFVSISYASECYNQSLNADKSSYTADFKLNIVTEEIEREDDTTTSDDTENIDDPDKVVQSDIVTTIYGQDYDNTIMKALYENIPSIKMILKSCQINLTAINSHALFSKKQVSNYSGVKIDKNSRAYSNVSINPLDEEMASILTYLGCEIEGSLEDVIKSNNTIAISDSFSNDKKFNFKVGDTIKIATDYVKLKNTSGIITTDYDDMLKEYLNCYDYTYTEYTIGAVIKNLPTGNILPIYAPNSVFEEIAGHRPYYDHIDIIFKDNVSQTELKKAEYTLRSYADYYGNVTITQTDADYYQKIEKNKNYPAVFTYVAFILLLVVPIIFMFSQILFYLKRKQEFDIFFALGATNSQIHKSFMIEALVLSVVSLLFYVLTSMIAIFAIKLVANSQMWQYLISTERIMRFDYKIPVIEFIIGLLITILSAFLSAYVPYKLYKKSCHPVFTGDYFNDTEISTISGTDEGN